MAANHHFFVVFPFEFLHTIRMIRLGIPRIPSRDTHTHTQSNIRTQTSDAISLIKSVLPATFGHFCISVYLILYHSFPFSPDSCSIRVNLTLFTSTSLLLLQLTNSPIDTLLELRPACHQFCGCVVRNKTKRSSATAKIPMNLMTNAK